MYPEGDDRPPQRPDEPERPDRGGEPEYTVYGPGGESRKAKPPEPPEEPVPPAEEPEEAPAPPAEEPDAAPAEKPEYTVYRSRPGLRDRLRKPDMQSLRRERRGPGGGFRDRLRTLGGSGGKRRWLRWALIAAGAWLAISFLAFALSAQIQKGKLSDKAKAALSGGPVLTGSNILILGGDQRTGAVGKVEPGAEVGAPRSDTIMVVHAGLGSFRKLSIPRDSYAEVPGCGTQKINAAFACGGFKRGNAAASVKAVENFLGIDVNHVVIVDFAGFVDFIDAIGGVKVDLPNEVCGSISGGKQNGGQGIRLDQGEHTLRALQALALARLRHNECDPSESDIERAQRQQLILNGIKAQLTDPLRAPINFIKGPIIGWSAPKAFVSDLGGLNLPQLALTSIFGGGKTAVLEPNAPGPDGSLLIPASECRKKVEKLLGSEPPREPACSPI